MFPGRWLQLWCGRAQLWCGRAQQGSWSFTAGAVAGGEPLRWLTSQFANHSVVVHVTTIGHSLPRLLLSSPVSASMLCLEWHPVSG